MKTWKLAVSVFYLAAPVALCGPLLAGQGARDAQRLSSALKEARSTLVEAIRKAGKRAGGIPFRAQVELEGNRILFEIRLLKEGDTPQILEVKVDARNGKVVGVDDETGDEDAVGESAAGEERSQERRSAPSGGFTDSFPVDKGDLSPTGRNPFFILEPGYTLVLEKKGSKTVRLSVTVLDETRIVDGVVTRVVEERETVNGKVVEVSRNYFAISGKTGNVYYFGENAGGAWESGKRGARFGLMMPGTPLLGAKYYNEMAPGKAMDRAEVVSLKETFESPAGTFANCLKVEETTPLERGEREYKLYAPGIGLVFDEGMKLVKYGKK